MAEFLSFSDVARQLAVSRSTVTRWAKEGVGKRGRERMRLAYVVRGSRCLTTAEALSQFLARCRSARWQGFSDPVAEAAEALLQQQLSNK